MSPGMSCAWSAKGDKGVKLSCWGQFVALFFGQGQHSLRDQMQGERSCSKWGLGAVRSNYCADARAQIFGELFGCLYQRCRRHSRAAFRLPATVRNGDRSVPDLGEVSQAKRGDQLHLILDH